MSRFYRALEKRFARYAVPSLTVIIIGCYVIGYVLQLIRPGIAAYMTLEPALIVKGQVWRLITWLVIPPGSLGIFTIIMLFFYFSIGRTLEKSWGDFRYNVYIFGGIFLTIVTAFICWAVLSAVYGTSVTFGSGGASPFSTYYISLSIFLGFAATFPEARVYLYFILPIKIKWLGILYVAFLAYDAVGYLRAIASGYTLGWVYIAAMAAALINFALFILMTGRYKHLSPGEMKRRRDFERASRAGREEAARRASAGGAAHGSSTVYMRGNPQGAAGAPRHRCEICGKTDITDPDMTFRFCSKCAGSHEYCEEHLFTHTHIQ